MCDRHLLMFGGCKLSSVSVSGSTSSNFQWKYMRVSEWESLSEQVSDTGQEDRFLGDNANASPSKWMWEVEWVGMFRWVIKWVNMLRSYKNGPTVYCRTYNDKWCIYACNHEVTCTTTSNLDTLHGYSAVVSWLILDYISYVTWFCWWYIFRQR